MSAQEGVILGLSFFGDRVSVSPMNKYITQDNLIPTVLYFLQKLFKPQDDSQVSIPLTTQSDILLGMSLYKLKSAPRYTNMSPNIAYAFTCSRVQGREQAVSSNKDSFSPVQKKRLLNINWQHRQYAAFTAYVNTTILWFPRLICKM